MVTKEAIQDALGRGETWRREAEEGIRILDEYGEGGSKPAAEVIEEINRRRDAPRGARILLMFLKDFEKKVSQDSEGGSDTTANTAQATLPSMSRM